MSSASSNTSRRMPTWGWLLAAIALVTVCVIIFTAALISTGKGADPNIDRTTPNGPADTLRDRPQSEQLGGDGGGGD